jgi:histone acetyltransferase MYST1
MTASDAEMPPAVEPAVLANGGGDAPAPAVTAKDARVAKPPDAGAGAKIAPGGAGDLDAPAAAAATPTSTLEPPAAAPKAWVKGDRVSALATFDRTYHPADVIDVRRAFPEDDHHEGSVSYYVRYAGFDKRLDEWLPGSALEPYTSAVEDALTDDKADLSSPRAGDADTPRASGRKLTRNLKRRYNEINNVAGAVEDLAPIDQKLEKEHDEKTKVKNIGCVEFGKYQVDAWYFSPYPDEYTDCAKLYVCEHCLKYMRHEKTLLKHKARCAIRHPPGKMIYRHPRHQEGKPGLAFWEVDGHEHKVYCQNLCLLAKLFLDHKTLYFDVDPFLFYVMTEFDERTNKHAVVGYFSKEKWSNEDYNLACILTLPPYQRKGYGSFLIAMSYEISRREDKVGTPERPLSDLGAVSYRSFWCREVLQVLHRHKGSVSVKDISAATGFQERDIASALQSLNLLKYWKGQHIISATPKIIEEHMRSFDSKHQICVNQSWFSTQWRPPVFAPPPKPLRGGANRQ